MRAPRIIAPKPTRNAKALPTGCGALVFIFFILPHTLIGVFLIGQTLLTTAWFLGGDDTIARVTHAWPNPGKKSTSYEAAYVYKDGPSEFSNKETISKEFYDQLPASLKLPGPGRNSALVSETYPMTVRLLSVGRFHHVAAIPPAGRSPLAQFLGLLLGTLFWNGLLSVFHYRLWIKPLRMRRRAARIA